MTNVTPEQFKKIKEKMPNKTKKQKIARKSFEITTEEREILQELVTILGWFEWVTDEFQSNRVSISKVFPCVTFLRRKLSNVEAFCHTQELCETLLASLEKRFGKLIKNEVFSNLIFFICIFFYKFLIFVYMFSFNGLCRVNLFGSEFWAQRVPTRG